MAVTVGIGRDLRSTLGSTGNDADGAAVLVVALASTTDARTPSSAHGFRRVSGVPSRFSERGAAPWRQLKPRSPRFEQPDGGETKRATGEAFGRSLCLFPVGTHRRLRGLAQNRPPGGASAGAVAAVNERSPPHRPGEARTSQPVANFGQRLNAGKLGSGSISSR